MGTLTSPRVLVCNNGWASDLLDVEVSTTPNVVVVSEPMANLALTSTVHHDRGYVYAREIDGRCTDWRWPALGLLQRGRAH